MILQRQFTHFSNTVDMVNERMNPCLRVLLPQPQVSTFLSSGHLLDLISFSSPFLPATKSPSSWENEVLLWVQNLGQPKAAKPIRWQNHVKLFQNVHKQTMPIQCKLKIKIKSWGGVGREVQEGGVIRILMADSCCCMAETNRTF